MEKLNLKFSRKNFLEISISEKFVVKEVGLIVRLEKKMVFGDG